MAVRTNVNVNSAPSGRIALCPGVAELPDEFLQGVHVLVAEDRGDQFAFLIIGTGDADVL